MRFEIKVIEKGDVENVVRFSEAELSKSLGISVGDPPPDGSLSDVDIKRTLLEHPSRREGDALGYMLVGGDGQILGSFFLHRRRFKADGKEYAGLGMGTFYVSRKARMGGFFLFKKYVSIGNVDFLFCTTSNLAAGRLWAAFGGVPVPGSEEEYLDILKGSPFGEEAALRRRLPPPFLSVMRMAGSGVAKFRSRRIDSNSLPIEACTDDALLSKISERNRQAGLLQLERTPGYFAHMSPERAAKFVFRSDGGQGFIIVGERDRGMRNQIRTLELLDWSLPRDTSRESLFVTLRELAKTANASAVSVRPQPTDVSADGQETKMPFWRRRLPGPTAYVISRKHSASWIAQNIELPVGDYF